MLQSALATIMQSDSEEHSGDGDQHRHHQPQHHPPREDANAMLSRPRTGPLRSVEGWVVFVTGVHEEAQEDDLVDAFSEHGKVNKVCINVDRRTGMAKGYALVEYEQQSEAQDAINTLHGTNVLGKVIGVHWAFVKPTGHSGSNQLLVDSNDRGNDSDTRGSRGTG